MNTRIRSTRGRGAALVSALAMVGAGLAVPAHAQSATSQPPNSTGSPAPMTPDQTAPPGAAALASDTGLSAAQQQAVTAAVTQATRTGKAVPVLALTSETWQVSAHPGGGLELSANPAPVRTLRNGAWVPVDTSLHKNADGTLSPAATAYATVRLSGGGSAPLATTTTASGASYQISWPGVLPAPSVSGSTATYTDVLPGVDLALTPTVAGGFSEVLVVHSANAAANPALAKLTLRVRTTGTHSVRGALAAADGMTLEVSGAMMWDSNTTPAAASAKAARSATSASGSRVPSVAQIAASDPSSAAHAGYAAHQAPLAVDATDNSMSLVPDHSLLTSKSAVFPEYIDPTMQWHPASGGTAAYDETKQGSPCNSQPYYNDTAIDDNQLGVGWTNTYCGGYQRTFYQWKLPSAINGAYIHLATVSATEDWQASFSCSESRTVDLHWSVGIGSGTDYNNTNPGYLTGANAFTTSASVGAAYNPSGCTSPATSKAGFTVTTPVQWSANHSASAITFAMDQGSDTNYADFDRFTDNPTLDIQFDHAPATPGAGQLSASINSSDKAACATASPYPYIGKAIVGSQVTLNAANITEQDGDQLRATFKYWIHGSSTTATVLSADSLASGSTAQGQIPLAFTDALADGAQVDWQVQTTNGTYTSNWSPTCSFIAEPTGPDEPSIAANTTYPDNATGAAAGTSATFTVTGNSDGSVATKFYYALDQATATAVTANANAASFAITPVTAGQHTLSVYAVDAAGDLSGTNSYTIIAAGHAPTTCANLAACFNNTAISSDSSPSQANADGGGYSLSATTLANAGWNSGGNIVIDGANLTLPAFGSGQKDNVLAANQTIDCTSAMGNCTIPATGASSLVILATANDGVLSESGGSAEGTTAPYIPAGSLVAGTYSYSTGGSGNTLNTTAGAPTGTITYSGQSTPSGYTLTVPDWETGPASLAVVSLPYFNNPAGKKQVPARLYAFSIPLQPGQTIQSVTLPDLANSVAAKTPIQHIFAIGIRNTTMGTVESDGTTAATSTYTSGSNTLSDTWTGAFASDTEGNYNFESGNFSSQSFRVLLQPTVTGSTVRVKLDNALGTSPLTIGGASIATTTGNAITPTAATSSTPVALTFGHTNSTSVTIPEGGMVYSDPLAFNVTAGQWLAVSFYLQNSVPYLPQHSWATDSYEYVTAIGSGNHTTESASTAYTATGSLNGTYTDVVTGLDVQTQGTPTQVVLGDNLIDAWQPNTAPLSPNNGAALRLSDDIAAASSTTPTPYGTVNAGIESNQLVKDNPQILNGTSTGAAVGGQAALTRIDRDLLDEPGLNTVILDEGLEDALAGTNESTIEAGYTELLAYLAATGISNTGGTETWPGIVDVGLTPCDTYNGDGAATGNDPCTASADANRTDVNTWLAGGPDGLNPWSGASGPTLFYVDPDATIGVADTGNGETKLAPLAMVGTSRNNNTPSDPVNLTNAGTGALANAILAATDTWNLTDGTGTIALDTIPTGANAYLTQTDANTGNNPLTLNGTFTWPTATVGTNANTTVLSLDGTTGYAATSGPVINTTGSFTVSAWVDLTALPTHNAAIAAQDSGATTPEESGFNLDYEYNSGNPGWALKFATTDTVNPSFVSAFTTGASTGWNYIVGTYNASTKTAQLYVNGTLKATTANITTWNATGSFTVGRNLYNGAASNFWPGSLSGVQAWNYALSAPQITALYTQIN